MVKPNTLRSRADLEVLLKDEGPAGAHAKVKRQFSKAAMRQHMERDSVPFGDEHRRDFSLGFANDWQLKD